MQAQVALALPVCQVQEQGAGRRTHPRAHAIAQVPFHAAEGLGRVARVDEYTHAPALVEIMVVLDAGHRQAGRADDRVITVDADTLITVAANRARPAGAKTEVIGHPGIRIGPYAPHFAAHGKHVALAHRPPLLPPQAHPEEGVAAVEHHAYAAAHGDQVAFARVILVVDIAPQPFGCQGAAGQIVFVASVDLDVVVRQQHTPAVFVLDAAVARALPHSQPGRAQRHAAYIQALDIGMIGQQPDRVALAFFIGRQMKIQVGTPAQAVDAYAAFKRDRDAAHDVLTGRRYVAPPRVDIL